MDKDITKKYSNDEITIVWRPKACIHSTMCWRKDVGLPEVFDPRAKPWINPEGASTEKMIAHIQKCPSGALSFYYNKDEQSPTIVSSEAKVEALANGPLLVYGNITIKTASGQEEKKSKVTAFCRCGHSANKPYCDGNHIKHNFQG